MKMNATPLVKHKVRRIVKVTIGDVAWTPPYEATFGH